MLFVSAFEHRILSFFEASNQFWKRMIFAKWTDMDPKRSKFDQKVESNHMNRPVVVLKSAFFFLCLEFVAFLFSCFSESLVGDGCVVGDVDVGPV